MPPVSDFKASVLIYADYVERTADQAKLFKQQTSAGYDLEFIASMLGKLHGGIHRAKLADVVDKLHFLSSFALDYPDFVKRESWWHGQVRVTAAMLRGMFSTDDDSRD